MSKEILNEKEQSAGVNIHTSEAAHRRLKQRYAREKRFRFIGLSAVLVSCLFLAFLLVSIFKDALPVLNQHYLNLELPLKAEDIDPEGKRTAESVANANYGGLVKSWLRETFPNVSGRRNKKALYGLVSSNAGSEIQQKVMADPSLVGQPLKTSVLLSDYADLYFKGAVSTKETITTNGIASPVGTTGEVKILSTSNDFKSLLQEIKLKLNETLKLTIEQQKAKERAKQHYENLLSKLKAELKNAGGEKAVQLKRQITECELSLDAANTQIKLLAGEIQQIQARVAAANKTEKVDREMPSFLIKINGGVIKVASVSTTQITGQALLPLRSETEQPTGKWEIIKVSPPESSRKLSDKEIVWLDKLQAEGRIEKKFNTQFFSTGASREAEVAGIWGAVVGTFYTMLVTLLISFPIGVCAAIYLEEFAPKNKITDLIEVNINNLAAVPSIVFGLLGLAMFLNIFGMPRSAPLVGGMVLALMTLPTIIIASRAALKAVPPSIKEAALGLGASHMQAVFHHTLPLAMPGILTGSIIGMAQALGETAPLLMIGMVAFIVDIPGATGFAQGFTDPATVLPVQIYMWADFPEKLFQQKTAAAIVVLLMFLIMMNALAVILRKRFERRW